MVRLLIVLSWITFWASALVAQNVSVVAEYNDFRVAGGMAISKSNDIFVGGRFNGSAMLMKFDSLGNELWTRYYPEYGLDYDFGRIIIDEEDKLYIHLSKGNSVKRNFIVKLDVNGNELWKSDTLPGARVSAFPIINLMLRDSILSIVHDSQEELGTPYPMVSQINTTNGGLVYQTPPIVETFSPFQHYSIPFVNNAWVLSCASGVLNVAEDASYNYIPLGDSVPGILTAATNENYITYQSSFTKQLDNFEEWSSFLFLYDDNWNLNTSVNLKSLALNDYDTLSTSIYSILPVKSKGLIASGVTIYVRDGNDSSFLWFSQLNPDNGSIKWEQLMPNTAGITLMSSKEDIYALGALGLSQTGIRLYKIEVPDITYESEFITNVEQVVEQPVFSKVYPNPSNTQFTLEANEVIQTIELYTLDGRLVLAENVQQEVYNLEVLTNGIYILRMEFQNGAVETQRIVKW